MDNFWRVCILTVAVFLVLFFRLHDLAAQEGRTIADSKTKTYSQKIRQELTVHTVQGRQEGPTPLIIVAGIHGNEAAGDQTAERYIDVRLKKGNVIIVPCLNGPAVNAEKLYGLGGDMYRLFSLPMGSSNPDAKLISFS